MIAAVAFLVLAVVCLVWGDIITEAGVVMDAIDPVTGRER